MLPKRTSFVQQLVAYDNCADDIELGKKLTVLP